MRAFEPLRFNSMEIPARIVRSATSEGGSDASGLAGPALERIYVDCARGDCPLIITGYAYVHPSGRSGSNQNALVTDEHGSRWQEMVAAVHEANPRTRIGIQLVHGGRQVSAELVASPMAPSAVPDGVTPREMTAAEIARTVDDFARAAERARDAGFDCVQLHMAHGFLLSEFLSPHTNRRTDEFGGSPEKRRRMPLDVVARVREVTGDGFPILVKMNCADLLPGGLASEEAAEHARALEDASVDGIEISAWMAEAERSLAPSRPGDPTGKSEAYYLSQARVIRRSVRCAALGLCGGIRSTEMIERLLTAEGFDFVAMSRPFIAEPDLVRNLRKGAGRVKCISCNRCIEAQDGPIHCPLVDEGKL